VPNILAIRARFDRTEDIPVVQPKTHNMVFQSEFATIFIKFLYSQLQIVLSVDKPLVIVHSN
jgi:hypothetical protein